MPASATFHDRLKREATPFRRDGKFNFSDTSKYMKKLIDCPVLVLIG
jgi:hypothetical protein